jgi:hypothetical protein
MALQTIPSMLAGKLGIHNIESEEQPQAKQRIF